MIINLADGIDSCVKSLKDKLIIDNYLIEFYKSFIYLLGNNKNMFNGQCW